MKSQGGFVGTCVRKHKHEHASSSSSVSSLHVQSIWSLFPFPNLANSETCSNSWGLQRCVTTRGVACKEFSFSHMLQRPGVVLQHVGPGAPSFWLPGKGHVPRVCCSTHIC